MHPTLALNENHVARFSLLIIALSVFLGCTLSFAGGTSAQVRYNRKYSLKTFPRKPNATPRKSSKSTVGLDLRYLTPDKNGGVWITGNALMVRGLMVNDRDGQVTAITIPGVGDVSNPRFFTRDVGWMLDIHSLRRTVDAGRSWQKVHLPGDLEVWAFHFPDIQNGWAAGWDGALYHTSDVGRTWKKQETGLDYNFREIFFVDALHGWIIGTKRSGNLQWKSASLRTSDGGESWQLLSNEDSTSTRSVGSLVFVDSNEGWGTDGQCNIVHTLDGGKSWTEQWPNEGHSWNSLFFRNNREGWAAGNTGILHTLDGGETWEYELRTDGLSSNSVDQIVFTDADRGWAVGGFRVLRTTDGGKTWQRIPDDWINALPSFETFFHPRISKAAYGKRQ